MKLGISGLFLQPGQVGGAERMLQGLLQGLSAQAGVQTDVYLTPQGVDWLHCSHYSPKAAAMQQLHQTYHPSSLSTQK